MRSKAILLLVLVVVTLSINPSCAIADLVRVRGGSLPVGASSPFDPSAADEYDLASLVDGSNQTGIKVNGIEGTYDTGGYLLLEFQTEYNVDEIQLEVYLHSFYGEKHTSVYMGCSADLTFAPFWSIRPYSEDLQTLSATFTGNDLDDIRLPDNRFQFFFWSPFMDGIHDQGEQGIEIVEAYMIYQPIPEPATLLLIGLGGLALRKGNRRFR